MTINEIVKEAGHFAEPLHQALDYLANHQNDKGLLYRLGDMNVRATLEHFRLHKTEVVYRHYKHVYESIVARSDDGVEK